jgi:raffinose/stachyose/melibiose transport system substrate-binding protein
VPKTITEFEAMLPTIKASGMLPIAYGDVEKSPGIHIYGITQAAIAGPAGGDDLVTGRSGAWTDEPSVKAAQTIQDWATKGYITEGANGISRDDALAEFGKGKSAFVIHRHLGAAQGDQESWRRRRIRGAGTGRVGHPGHDRRRGLGLGHHHGQQTPRRGRGVHRLHHQRERLQVLIDNGNLPAVPPADWAPKAGTCRPTWLTSGSGSTPDLVAWCPIWTTPPQPSMTRCRPAVQQLTAKKLTPQQFAEQLQKDYAAFLKSK